MVVLVKKGAGKGVSSEGCARDWVEGRGEPGQEKRR